MEISKMITERMVREICPWAVDSARFLFVDAWDYFEKKGWKISVESFSDTVEVVMVGKTGAQSSFKSFNYKDDYPSRLHAMAAAVAYMWEQEKKNNER